MDGNNITSLLSCFFLLFMRPLLDAGIVYRALPPLYLINPKSISKYYHGEKWLFDKNEYYQLFHSLIADNVDIALQQIETKNNEVVNLNKKQKMEWLNLNSEYLLELDSLTKRTACNPLILEYVCAYKLIASSDDIKFKTLIETEFDELHYDLTEQTLFGSYKGEFVSLIADKLFIKIAKRFIQLLDQNEMFIVYCKNKNDPNDKYTKMTIGQFLSLMGTQFNIVIDQRYKGLGDAMPSILFSTTTNPKVRKLVRLTVEDLEKSLDIFRSLHGKSEELREGRRNILEQCNFKLSDIDN